MSPWATLVLWQVPQIEMQMNYLLLLDISHASGKTDQKHGGYSCCAAARPRELIKWQDDIQAAELGVSWGEFTNVLINGHPDCSPPFS